MNLKVGIKCGDFLYFLQAKVSFCIFNYEKCFEHYKLFVISAVKFLLLRTSMDDKPDNKNDRK